MERKSFSFLYYIFAMVTFNICIKFEPLQVTLNSNIMRNPLCFYQNTLETFRLFKTDCEAKRDAMENNILP